MAKQKQLNGVAHNIAHHAISGLSYLHPYLGQLADKDRLRVIVIDLLSKNAYDETIEIPAHLQLATENFRNKFKEMVVATGNSIDIIQTATVTFHDFDNDNYRSTADAYFKLISGAEYKQSVDKITTKDADTTHHLGPNWLP